jgi:acyl-CoA thioester hydrolase
MARLKIQLPEQFIYTTQMELRIGDINYGGHLANDAVLALVHEARLRFLDTMNYSEKNIESRGLIMNDAAIVYKSEAFHGDIIIIQIALDDISNTGFDLYYKISNKETGKDIAWVKTGLTFFDYATRKISSTPDEFLKKATAYKPN